MSLDYCKRLYWSDDLRYHLVSIGPQVHGFIYRSKKGILHILADETLSPSARRETILHEAYHAANDMKPGDYVVGLNRLDCVKEKEADEYVLSAR